MGGINKYWEPLDIETKFPTLAPFTIVARTHTRDGMRMEIFIADFGETPCFEGRYWHTAMDPFYEGDIFRDIRETYHLYCELTEKNPYKLTYTEFERLIKAVRSKCEGRYGNLLPDSDYEVKVTFS